MVGEKYVDCDNNLVLLFSIITSCKRNVWHEENLKLSNEFQNSDSELNFTQQKKFNIKLVVAQRIKK